MQFIFNMAEQDLGAQSEHNPVSMVTYSETIRVDKSSFSPEFQGTAIIFENSYNAMLRSLEVGKFRVYENKKTLDVRPPTLTLAQKKIWDLIQKHATLNALGFIEICQLAVAMNAAVIQLGNVATTTTSLFLKEVPVSEAFENFGEKIAKVGTIATDFENKSKVFRTEISKNMGQLIEISAGSKEVHTAFEVQEKKEQEYAAKLQELSELESSTEAIEIELLGAKVRALKVKEAVLEEFQSKAKGDYSAITKAFQNAVDVHQTAVATATKAEVHVTTSYSCTERPRRWWDWWGKHRTDHRTTTVDTTARDHAMRSAKYAKRHADKLANKCNSYEEKVRTTNEVLATVVKTISEIEGTYTTRSNAFKRKVDQIEDSIKAIEEELTQAKAVISGLHEQVGIQRENMLKYLETMSSISMQAMQSSVDASTIEKSLQVFYTTLCDQFNLFVASESKPLSDVFYPKFSLFAPILVHFDTKNDLEMCDEGTLGLVLADAEKIAVEKEVGHYQILLNQLKNTLKSLKDPAINVYVREQIAQYGKFITLLGQHAGPRLDNALRLNYLSDRSEVQPSPLQISA